MSEMLPTRIAEIRAFLADCESIGFDSDPIPKLVAICRELLTPSPAAPAMADVEELQRLHKVALSAHTAIPMARDPDEGVEYRMEASRADRDFAVALAALARPAAPDGWRDIATFDGRTQAVLVRCPERMNTYTACYRGGVWQHFGGNGNAQVSEPITHWHELPSFALLTAPSAASSTVEP